MASETDRDPIAAAAAEHIAPSLLPGKRQSGEFSGEEKQLVRELGRHDIIARNCSAITPPLIATGSTDA